MRKLLWLKLYPFPTFGHVDMALYGRYYANHSLCILMEMSTADERYHRDPVLFRRVSVDADQSGRSG
jgi:hypothetical protein